MLLCRVTRLIYNPLNYHYLIAVSIILSGFATQQWLLTFQVALAFSFVY